MGKMDTEVYKKSFFEKKIVVKNEIIYYFENDDLKEAISVEKFDKRVVETEYVSKEGLSLFLEIITPEPNYKIRDKNKYKKLIKYRKLKFFKYNFYRSILLYFDIDNSCLCKIFKSNYSNNSSFYNNCKIFY